MTGVCHGLLPCDRAQTISLFGCNNIAFHVSHLREVFETPLSAYQKESPTFKVGY